MSYDINTWIKVASFVGSGVSMGLGAIGAGIGEGYTAAKASEAVSRNPKVAGEVFKTMLVGQAIAETAGIFGLVIAMMLLFLKNPHPSFISVAVYIGAGLCMGCGAIGSGIGGGFPAGEACAGIARQPAMTKRLNTTMLIGSSICQTPAIFALVTAVILIFADFSSHPVSPTWAAVLGAGLASGIGAIGPGLGDGLVAGACCEGVARQPTAATPTTTTMLLGMAVTETTAIYGLLVSFILMFKTFPATDALAPAMALLAAGLCMGVGAIGPGIGEGLTAKSAVGQVARNQGHVAGLTRVMLVGQAVAESTGIYSLVISLVLIFVV
ncbi:MAG: ATP synthase F0 subunit C [Proteobacteria bacterium]|nr:ATP synthase F0 subunit C [Pseudomonadota bacterium]